MHLKRTISCIIFSAVFFTASILFAAPPPWAGKPDSAPNKNKEYGKSYSLKPGNGNHFIQSVRHVYYPGDVLQVKVVLPRSLAGVWPDETGEVQAEANILLQTPSGEFLSFPIDEKDMEPDVPRIFFELPLDTRSFEVGNYQLALILTKLDGSPLKVEEWYNGFQGHLGITRIKFNMEIDEEDQNGDGEIDCDLNKNGYLDDGEGCDAEGDETAKNDGAANDGTING